MIYYREKINSFTDALHNCSVIVLVSQNYNLLQKEAQKISDTIAGANADEEMRITRYFNKEINGGPAWRYPATFVLIFLLI